MKLKKIAMRGLIILAVAVALCMFFARTVQTITTPKVKLVSAQSGRLEVKMNFTGQVYFPEEEEFILKDAAKTSVTVKAVYVGQGHWVDEGDVIFTTEVKSFDDEVKKLQEQYDEKNRSLIDLDIQNRKLSKESRQNELYDIMLEAQDELAAKSTDARVMAMENGIRLTGDVNEWSKQLAVQTTEVPEELSKAVAAAVTANSIFEGARGDFYAILEDKKLKAKDELFNYVRSRNELLDAMADLETDIVELTRLVTELAEVKATRSGFITQINVRANEPYDGSKAAYCMNKEDVQPVFRCSLSGIDRTIADETKAEIKNENYGTTKTVVQKTVTEKDNSKYLYIAIPEEMLQPKSTQIRRYMNEGGPQITITYRAKQATTILPASCVRNEGENQDYVYLIQNSWGGFMSGASMKVVKTQVTVLERSDTSVSISEDLNYQQVADGEDRSLSDGATVMEYVQ